MSKFLTPAEININWFEKYSNNPTLSLKMSQEDGIDWSQVVHKAVYEKGGATEIVYADHMGFASYGMFQRPRNKMMGNSTGDYPRRIEADNELGYEDVYYQTYASSRATIINLVTGTDYFDILYEAVTREYIVEVLAPMLEKHGVYLLEVLTKSGRMVDGENKISTVIPSLSPTEFKCPKESQWKDKKLAEQHSIVKVLA